MATLSSEAFESFRASGLRPCQHGTVRSPATPRFQGLRKKHFELTEGRRGSDRAATATATVQARARDHLETASKALASSAEAIDVEDLSKEEASGR